MPETDEVSVDTAELTAVEKESEALDSADDRPATEDCTPEIALDVTVDCD